MQEKMYNREAAVAYAKEWALSRNPRFLDYSGLGGDCTNFCSQCLLAGGGVMNYAPKNGWYYIDGNRKSPSWTGVQYLKDFLVSSPGVGPFARLVGREKLLPGDLIQLKNTAGLYYHSLVVLELNGGDPLIAAHTIDSLMRPLSTYTYQSARYLHIVAVRTQ